MKNDKEPDPKKRHEVDRFAVTEVVCSMCDERQPVQQDCRKCGVRMGEYYCGICKFFDDDLSKVKQCFVCSAVVPSHLLRAARSHRARITVTSVGYVESAERRISTIATNAIRVSL